MTHAERVDRIHELKSQLSELEKELDEHKDYFKGKYPKGKDRIDGTEGRVVAVRTSTITFLYSVQTFSRLHSAMENGQINEKLLAGFVSFNVGRIREAMGDDVVISLTEDTKTQLSVHAKS